MSDLISREKEFLKLNDELDKKAKVIIEQSDKPTKSNNRSETYRQPLNEVDFKQFQCSPPLKQPWTKPNTLPRHFRDVLTTRKPPKNKKVSSIEKWNEQVVQNEAKIQDEKTEETATENTPSVSEESNVMKTARKFMNASQKLDDNFDEKVFSEATSSFKLLNSQRSSRTDSESVTSSLKTSRSSELSTDRKNMSSNGLIKFLKAKVSILQTEVQSGSLEYSKVVKQLEGNCEAQKKIEQQRDQAISKNNSLVEQMAKLEEKFSGTEMKIKEREMEFSSISREFETLKREFKLLTQTNKNLEKRLYHANEELENHKSTVNTLKQNENELKKSIQIERDTYDKQVKSLKKQRTDLLQAYKKQLFLIDNLKRQNMVLEQARMISFGEKEFTKVLEWNASN